MALIKGRNRALDSWKLLEMATDGTAVVPSDGKVVVPLSAWRSLRTDPMLNERRWGVWLAGGDDPAELENDLGRLELIAVRFDSFTDGRGYSTARLLRERYGWRGELRAIGDVQRDQIYYLFRCGFDAFDLRDGEDVDSALAAFNDFSEAYQAAVDRPSPLFRRRETTELT